MASHVEIREVIQGRIKVHTVSPENRDKVYTEIKNKIRKMYKGFGGLFDPAKNVEGWSDRWEYTKNYAGVDEVLSSVDYRFID